MKKKNLFAFLVALMIGAQLAGCATSQSNNTGNSGSNDSTSSDSISSNDTSLDSTSSDSTSSDSTSEEPPVKTYVLTLYVDGKVYDEKELEEGAGLGLETPEKGGYVFSGWYTDAEYLNAYTGGAMPAAELNLYGKFTAETAEMVKVNYVYGGKTVTDTLEKGSILTSGRADSIKAQLEEGDYTFVSWKSTTGEEVFGTAVTEDLTLVGDFYSNGFELDGGMIFMYEGDSTDVVVPAKIGDTEITGIDEFAFWGMKNITSVYVSEGVKKVGEAAFADCTMLTDVYLPTTLENIGIEVFSGCKKLAEGGIHFAGSAAYPVENGIAYGNTDKTVVLMYVGKAGDSVVLPEGVTEILARAFENMNVGSIEIPASVQKIGKNVFLGSKLVSVNYLTSLDIPESCFKNCIYLEEINISDEVSVIGANAFDGCTALSEIKFPEALQQIGTGAFFGCLNLKKVTLPDGYCNFTGTEFSGAGIEEFTIPSYLTEIGENMFLGWTHLKSIEIPEGITKIGNGAFMNCTSLQSVNIPSTVVSIGRPADEEKGESSYFYNQTGSLVFGNCTSLTNVDVSKATSLDYIGPRAFFGCSALEYFEIPENVTMLEAGALAGLPNLKHLKLPFIGRYSQKGFQKEVLTAVINVAILHGVSDYEYTGKESYDELLAEARKLNEESRAIVAESPHLTELGKKLFDNAGYYFGTQQEYDEFLATTDSSVSSYSVLGYIFGEYNYAGATAIKQYYGGTAVSGSTGVTYYFPSQLEKLEVYKTETLAAYALSNIQNVPELVTTSVKCLGAKSYYLTGVKEISLPESVTRLGDNCFQWAMQLKSITVPDSVTQIGTEAFANCIEVETVKLPDTENIYVGAYAFRDCDKLNHVYQTAEHGAKASGVYLDKGTYGNAILVGTPVKSIYVGENVIFALMQGTYDQMGGVFMQCDQLETIEIYNDFKCMLSQDVAGLGKAGDIVNIIPGYCFNHCESLKTVNGQKTFTIPEGIKQINSGAFSYSGFETVIIPQWVEKMGSAVFSNSNITGELDLRYVDSIGTAVFRESEKLTKVIFNKNVVFSDDVIGEGLFQGCSALSTIAVFDESTGTLLEKEGVAYIPSMEKTPRYFLKKTAIQYVEFTDPERLTELDMQFAYGCASLKEITLPSNLTSVAGLAFYGCTSLGKVNFTGSNLRVIGHNAFENCSALTEINIPEGVVDMGEPSIFRGCTNLRKVTLPSTVRKLPSNSAFRDCTSLRELVILASFAPDVDGGLLSGSSMLQMGEVGAEGALPDLIASGLKIYVPADSVELYKSHYSTYNMFLRNKTGWRFYADAILPLYSGVYTDGTTVLNVYQSASAATVSVNGAEPVEATVTVTDENTTFAFNGKTLAVSGRTGTYEGATLTRISGMYADQSEAYDVNNVIQYHSETNVLNEEIKTEAEDWNQERLLQFKNQMHIYPDGRVEIFEFKDSQAYVSKSYANDAAGNLINVYLTVYPATVYEGTWKIVNGNLEMTFTAVTAYKATMTGEINSDYTAIASFTLTRNLTSLLTGSISVAQSETKECLVTDYIYTRVK